MNAPEDRHDIIALYTIKPSDDGGEDDGADDIGDDSDASGSDAEDMDVGDMMDKVLASRGEPKAKRARR